MRLCLAALFASIVPLAGGCVFFGNPAASIPTQLIAAPKASDQRQLVIVLPGMGDDLRDLAESGIASTAQRHLPNADVLLVEFTFPYYMEGRAIERLHEEIVAPARERGYRDIYLGGASMGGMGVLMYEREHPGELAGLILMAPYMADPNVLKEIQAAGGLATWDPGRASPQKLTPELVPREEWRVVKSWLSTPERARNVWLICGKSDRLHAAAETIATVLPKDRYISLDGAHAWTVWTQGADQAFARIAAEGR